jgi:hypothetical protein
MVVASIRWSVLLDIEDEYTFVIMRACSLHPFFALFFMMLLGSSAVLTASDMVDGLALGCAWSLFP